MKKETKEALKNIRFKELAHIPEPFLLYEIQRILREDYEIDFWFAPCRRKHNKGIEMTGYHAEDLTIKGVVFACDDTCHPTYIEALEAAIVISLDYLMKS